MQWVFVGIALVAAMVELHTGTFYLAAVAAASLMTALLGFWIQYDQLIFVFLILCAILTGIVMMTRRNWLHGQVLGDLDIGQSVAVDSVAPRGLSVSYRGAHWQAVVDDGSVLAPGDTAIIVGRTDKVLHLAAPPDGARAQAVRADGAVGPVGAIRSRIAD